MIICNYIELLCDGFCVTAVDNTALVIPTTLRFAAVIANNSNAIVIDSDSAILAILNQPSLDSVFTPSSLLLFVSLLDFSVRRVIPAASIFANAVS